MENDSFMPIRNPKYQTYMKYIVTFLFIFWTILYTSAQIYLPNWKFKTGDNLLWSKPDFDDSNWATIKGNTIYENQGYDYNGYSWYRVHFDLDKKIRSNSFLKDSLRIIVARVDDIDATYLNGVKIGGIGLFPEDPNGPVGYYDALRKYVIHWNHPAIRWDAENVLSVRVFDGGGGGGLWGLIPNVDMVDLIDFVKLNTNISGFDFSKKDSIQKIVQVENSYETAIEGFLSLNVNTKKGIPFFTEKIPIQIEANQSNQHTFSFPYIENANVQYSFTIKNNNKQLKTSQRTPYILTPPESPKPKITNSLVYGARANHPFLWAITATGSQPMIFTAEGLPEGLSLNPKTGLITGKASTEGNYKVALMAKNQLGEVKKQIEIRIGDNILLTPPLGWNSWNAWGMAVSDEKVRQSAESLVTSGLVNHGWNYINIDDGWQGERDSLGNILTNKKFPDMVELGYHLHNLGLKYGIYSSPGELSCGGLLGSLDHEQQDVNTWASWGIDYIKYDWCSYNEFMKEQGRDVETWTQADYILPFKKLSNAIEKMDRDMVYSVANWGQGDTWEWGAQTGGQLWRTTGDIEDTWESLKAIGFSQEIPATYAGPGGWIDPDMLTIGWVGWGEHLHESRLTPAEQYTHMSLWALLSAPLLIGCDLSRIDAFTYNLLANDEIIAINQDPLGKGAKVIYHQDDIMIWKKTLYDNSCAIGIFNLSDTDRTVDIDWEDLDLENYQNLRDPWRQKNVLKKSQYSVEIEQHGVQLLILR